MTFMAADPRIGSNVSNRVFAGKVLLTAKLLIENVIEPPRFFVKALDGERNFFFQAIKIIGLVEHGPDTAHLEHEPLNHGVTLAHV